MTPKPAPSIRRLLDHLITEFALLNRAHLATELNVTKNTIDKLYQNRQRLSSKQILHIHEYFGVSVQEIRERSGQRD